MTQALARGRQIQKKWAERRVWFRRGACQKRQPSKEVSGRTHK